MLFQLLMIFIRVVGGSLLVVLSVSLHVRGAYACTDADRHRVWSGLVIASGMVAIVVGCCGATAA
jgi:hypothetical protein